MYGQTSDFVAINSEKDFGQEDSADGKPEHKDLINIEYINAQSLLVKDFGRMDNILIF